MGQKESGCQEERLIRRFRQFRQLVHRPTGNRPITFFFVLVRKGPPVHERIVPARRRTDQLLFGASTDFRGRSPDIGFQVRLFATAISTMVNLSTEQTFVTVCTEVLRHRDQIRKRIDTPNPGRQSINARRRRATGCHDRCSTGVAKWSLAMSVRERDAAGGQTRHRRRFDLGVAAQWLDPVI